MTTKGFFFIPYISYILYSRTLDRYYIGSTADVLEQRIRRHNSNHAGFTGRTSDWRLVYKEEFPDKVSALRREKEIKAWDRQRTRLKFSNSGESCVLLIFGKRALTFIPS